MARKLKLGLVLLTGFLLLVVILQNTDSVTTRVLSAEIELPRAVLLLITLAMGFVLGFATAFWRGRRKQKQVAQAEAEREAA
jgi:uncharacterized integral membrane protein